MRTSSFSGGSERFIKRQDVTTRLSYIAAAPLDLSQDLIEKSVDYDSSIVFAHPPDSATASALATLEAPKAEQYRHRFHRETINDSEVVLSGTSLGAALRQKSAAGYANSAINTKSPQMVYTERLIHEGQVVGALQHSFSPANERKYIEHLIDDDKMEALAEKHHDSLTNLAAHIALLLTLNEGRGSLGLTLERKQAAAPDAFFIRTDVKGSTHLALGEQQAAYEAYRSQMQVFMHDLVKDYEKRYLINHYGIEAGYSDQGDGSYLVLPLPKKYNPYDTRALADYRRYTIDPFMKEARAGLAAIGLQYAGDLLPHPEIAISGDFGNAQVDGLGRYVSSTMTALAAQQKEKSPQ